MTERKNIDRIFQEKFKDFEATPPEHVWTNIEAELRKKDDRKILPLWFRLSGIAAALTIGLIITDNVADQNDFGIDQNRIVLDAPAPKNDVNASFDDKNVIVEGSAGQNAATDGAVVKRPTTTETVQKQTGRSAESIEVAASPGKGKKARARTQIREVREKSRLTEDQELIVANAVESSSAKKDGNQDIGINKNRSIKENISQGRKNNSVIADTEPTTGNRTNVREDPTLENASPDDAPNNTKTLIAEISADELTKDTTAIATVVPNTLEELLNEKENNVTTNEPKLNRWQLSSNVAPIYFSSTSDGSPIDPSLAGNRKDYKQNLAYGLGVRYALNNKLTVRTGVNSIGMEYATNDVVFYQNTAARPLQHVSTSMQGAMIQIESKDANAVPIIDGVGTLSKFDANINQKTGYIEVPVELAYKVIDKKFGVEIIGGLSTLFLNENSISMTSAGTEMEIGKANNLNSTHFSTNIGLGLKYNFLKSFQINFEPMFKYQINTFSDSGNFKPYFFGLYSGVNYRF